MIRALLATMLWYCFDDHLAELFGNPELGLMPFWLVFLSFWVFAILVMDTKAVVKIKEK